MAKQCAAARPNTDPDVCAKAYPQAVETAREVARAHGYAVAVHGSMMRDLDLIVVPWREECAPADKLLDVLCMAWGGTAGRVQRHPHGRRRWLVRCAFGVVDVSVLPARSRRRAAA